LYINVRFVCLKQVKALTFASKFTYKTFITTYVTSAMSSVAHTETKLHNKSTKVSQ